MEWNDVGELSVDESDAEAEYSDFDTEVKPPPSHDEPRMKRGAAHATALGKPSSRKSHPDRVRDVPRDAASVENSKRGSSAIVRGNVASQVSLSTSSNSISHSGAGVKQGGISLDKSSSLSQVPSEGSDPSDTKTPPSSTQDLYARIEKLHNANKKLRAKLKEFSKLLDSKLGMMRIKARAPGTARIENTLEDSAVLQQELNNAEKQVAIYQRENARLLRSLDHCSSVEHLNELSDRITELTHQNKQLKGELSALSTINRRAEKSQQQLEKDSSAVPKQIRSLQSEIRHLREKARVATTAQRELEQSSVRDRSKMVSLQEKLRALSKDHDSNISGSATKEMEVHVTEMQNKVEKMKQRLSDQNKKAFKQRAHLKRQLQKRDEEIAELRHRMEEFSVAPRGVSVSVSKKRSPVRTKQAHQKRLKEPARTHKGVDAACNPRQKQVEDCQSRLDQLSECLVPRDANSAIASDSPAKSESQLASSDLFPRQVLCRLDGTTKSTTGTSRLSDVNRQSEVRETTKGNLVGTVRVPLTEREGNDAYASDGCAYSDEFDSD